MGYKNQSIKKGVKGVFKEGEKLYKEIFLFFYAMTKINITCYEPSGKPQGGWKPTGLERVFSSNSDFIVNHPNRKIPFLSYKDGELSFGGKAYSLSNQSIKHGNDIVYYIQIIKEWKKK